MSTAATPADPVAAFNEQLAQAKLDALRMLQQLMNSLADPGAPLSAAAREIRHLATSILRAPPMSRQGKQAPETPRPPLTNDRAEPNVTPSTPPVPRNTPLDAIIAAASSVLRSPQPNRRTPAAMLLARHAASTAGLPAP